MSPTAREPSRILDVALDGRVDHGAAVTVRLGDAAVTARLSWLGGPFHQLRADEPLAAARGDRFVLEGLCEGVVLDPAAPRHGTSNDLLISLRHLLDATQGTVPFVASEAAHHDPVRAGATEGSDPPVSEEVALRVDARLREAGWEPPADAELGDEERAALGFLREAGRVVRLGPAHHVHARVVADVERRVREVIAVEGSVAAPRLARELRTTPEQARLLLELLEAERVTERAGGAHVLRRPHN